MQTQQSVLGYRIDLYSHDYKTSTLNDKNGHSDRNIDYEINRLKRSVQELDKGYFDIFGAVN